MQKNDGKLHFFSKIFGHVKKKQYLCTRFRNQDIVARRNQEVFLAQLVEQLTLNQWVQGSSPWEDTERHPNLDVSFFVILLCVIILDFCDFLIIYLCR